MAEKNGFKLIWQVRNFLINPGIDREASSCNFEVESLNKSEWNLSIWNQRLKLMATLTKNDNNIALGLKCNAFILSMGKTTLPFPNENVSEHYFTSNSAYGTLNKDLIIHSDCSSLFQKRNEFLYCDSLTVCCQLIPIHMNPPQPLIYFALSTIKLISKRFSVIVNNFSSLNQDRVYKITKLGFFNTELSISFYNDFSTMIILDSNSGNNFIHLDKMFILDVDGMVTKVWDKRVHLVKSFLVPSSAISTKLKDKSRYFPNDQLTLLFEISGISHSLASIEGEVVGMTAAKYQDNIADFFGKHPIETIQSSPAEVAIQQNASNSLNDDLQQLLSEGTLTDFELRFSGTSIHAHKTILCARSSVFKAMLSTDMKESASNRVDIEEDLDLATMQNLVNFMYTDSAPSLDFDSTVKLYAAADKYDVPLLKQSCSRFLSSSLSVENVCSLLCLANRHSDKDLKSATHNFIFKHDEPIIDSPEWNLFMKGYPKLALETMVSLYQMKVKT